MFSSFEGIKIYLYPRDNNPPHFHVYYGEYEAIISIRTLEIIAGELPSKQLKKVIKWAEIVQEQLLNEFIRLQAK
ncbi:DUF4160 domain-containing protein [Runella salmonicolor]|uniref:DUF4160 domain-containing protein n=1 Tax=Runella salmonicolor TaxID=2950278 RepID=A0ABT1FJA3_9BACT|nr:DUF4160 domain-containing protein [Runella salmonicolor]MCP1381847.1 DUF4160 domain-containing protein [Runella salmonicolor]